MSHMKFYHRREQLRRWNEKEAELEKSEKKKPPRKNSRKIDFQLGSDGEPWVWVMGDHPDDLSIEDILEQEAQYEALKQAEIEAEALRKTKEAELLRLQQENEERIKREKKEKEERLKRKAAEAAAHHSRQEALQVEEERKQQEQEEKKALEEVKMRSEKLRKISLTEMEKKKNRRSSQIFIDFKQTRDMFIKQAEDNSKQIDDAWQEQEKKSKQVDNERRQIARKAREEHRRSLKSKFKTESMIVGMLSKSLQSNRDGKENVKPPMATRPVQGSRPTNKAAVREWFRDQEEPRGAGLDSKTQQVAPWFHGLISRQAAEVLLQNKPIGSFMVRVSEKVWGYAISYQAESRCKHFLVDASEGHYQFFGTNQLPHASLDELVEHHKKSPISMMGQELLKTPVGQACDPPDHADLFMKNSVETSYL